MKKLLIALFLFLVAAPAASQTLTSPPDTYNVLIAEGDSITAGDASIMAIGSYEASYQAIRPNIGVSSRAVGGSGINDMQARIAGTIALKPRFVTVLIGANDLDSGSYATANDWLSALWTYTDQLRAAGIKVAVGTVLPRYLNNAPVDAAFEARRAIVNPLIRAAVGTHIDAVIDYAGNSTIGDAADAQNTTYYGDGTHPTPAGQAVMAGIYTPVVDAMVTASGVPTYVPIPATYATGTNLNVVGDGSNAAGGVAPAFTRFPELPDPYTVAAGWIETTGTSYCLTTNGPPAGACNNKKFRITSNVAKFIYDDPIKYWGQPGVSHCHEVFGNRGFNAYTARASVMARPGSNNSGGPANATPYWIPCMTKMVGGKKYAVVPIIDINYYNEEVPEGTPLVNTLQKLHVRFRFIGGTRSSDPNDCRAKNEINIANGGPGNTCNPVVNAGTDRYSYIGNGFRMAIGEQGYACVLANGSITPTSTGANYSLVINKGAPGTATATDDPWYVGGVHTCVDGSIIEQSLAGQECWNGFDVSSPSGDDHVRYAIWDNLVAKAVCPTGWYWVPILQEKHQRPTRGWADYSTWTLESDAMYAAKCAQLGQTCPTGVGWSMHLDWINGWPIAVRNRWHAFCLGIPVPGNTNPAPHGCDSSTIDASGVLTIGAAPDGSRNPQVSNVWYDTNDVTKLKLVDTARQPNHVMKGM